MGNRVKIISFLCLLIAFKTFAITEIPICEKDRYKIHSAIFDSFIPTSQIDLDANKKAMIKRAKKASWHDLQSIEQLKNALVLFSNIRMLYSPCILKFIAKRVFQSRKDFDTIDDKALKPIKDFIDALSSKRLLLAIDKIKKENRQKLFFEMIHSDVVLLRKIAFYIRIFYINAIYGSEFGAHLSKITHHGQETSGYVPEFPRLKTPLYYNKNNDTIEGHIDMLFVGSGAGASVAASSMQEKGLRVAVVEKGPLVVPGAINTTDNFNFMESKGIRLSNNGSVGFLNAEVVGGGPTVNIDMSYAPTLPYIKHQFNQWHELGILPHDVWNEEEIKEAYAWVKNVFKPRVVDPTELNVNNSLLIKGASELGIPFEWFELNTYKKGESPYSVYDKKSSFDMLLLPSMMDKENPLTLLSNCKVNKVLIKDNKAVGVECIYTPKDVGRGIIDDVYGFNIKKGTKIKLFAKETVLSAGALGSSAILLKSGVKNKNIGRGFVCHPFVPLMGLFDRAVLANQGEPSTVFIDHFLPTDLHPKKPGFLIEVAAGQASLGALLNPGNPAQVFQNVEKLRKAGGLGVIVIDSPYYENRIGLNDKGNIFVHYELGKRDKKNLKEGIKTAARILFAANANQVSFHTYEEPMFKDNKYSLQSLAPDDDLDEVFKNFSLEENQTLIMAAHMMSSNKMGMSPKTSVVDPDYKVHGVDNLFVVDGSVFPSSVGANPMQSIYTIAKIFAERHYKKIQHHDY